MSLCIMDIIACNDLKLLLLMIIIFSKCCILKYVDNGKIVNFTQNIKAKYSFECTFDNYKNAQAKMKHQILEEPLSTLNLKV